MKNIFLDKEFKEQFLKHFKIGVVDTIEALTGSTPVIDLQTHTTDIPQISVSYIESKIQVNMNANIFLLLPAPFACSIIDTMLGGEVTEQFSIDEALLNSIDVICENFFSSVELKKLNSLIEKKLEYTVYNANIISSNDALLVHDIMDVVHFSVQFDTLSTEFLLVIMNELNDLQNINYTRSTALDDVTFDNLDNKQSNDKLQYDFDEGIPEWDDFEDFTLEIESLKVIKTVEDKDANEFNIALVFEELKKILNSINEIESKQFKQNILIDIDGFRAILERLKRANNKNKIQENEINDFENLKDDLKFMKDRIADDLEIQEFKKMKL